MERSYGPAGQVSALGSFVARPLDLDGVGRRGPAGEQSERLGGLRARFGRVGDDGQAVGEDFEPVEAELKLSHDRVVELLYALGVQADVVRGPQPAELVALGGELAHEVRQL